MHKKKQQSTSSLEGESKVHEALITRKGVIAGAIITALGTVLVALISKHGGKNDSPPPPDRNRFVGRVVDKVTRKNIGQAKISIEKSGVPPAITVTDSEGSFSFLINNPNQKVNVKIEAVGYQIYDLNIIPAENEGAQNFGLTPLQATPASPPTTAVPNHPRRTVSDDDQGKSDLSTQIRGRVTDIGNGEPIEGVLVSTVGHANESGATRIDGSFDFSSRLKTGEILRLEAKKEGYVPQEVVHMAGGQEAIIRMMRK